MAHTTFKTYNSEKQKDKVIQKHNLHMYHFCVPLLRKQTYFLST